MRTFLLKEIADQYIRENFVRIKDIFSELDAKIDIVKAPSYTTVVRDTLTPKKGWIIYNETTGGFQGYTGSAWVNF